MPLFEKHQLFLDFFLKTTPRQRKALLVSSIPSQRLSIAEIIFNFLQNNIPDISKEKTFFFPHKNILRKLSKKTVSGKKQKLLFAKHSLLIYSFLSKILPKLK